MLRPAVAGAVDPSDVERFKEVLATLRGGGEGRGHCPSHPVAATLAGSTRWPTLAPAPASYDRTIKLRGAAPAAALASPRGAAVDPR